MRGKECIGFMLRKLAHSFVVLMLVGCFVPSTAFAASTWNDAAFLDKSYEPSVMTWQSNSRVTLSGGAYTYPDTWGDGLPLYYLPTGGSVRFCNVGRDRSGAAIDLEVYGSSTQNLVVVHGTCNETLVSAGKPCEFWLQAAAPGTYGYGQVRISMYKAGTNTLANAKLAFGIYDLDANNEGLAETFTLNSSNATLYRFANTRLNWSGNSCSAPASLYVRGYDRSTACYVTSSAAQVNTSFSGFGCGMCYSFQGASIVPDSPSKFGVDSK